MPVKTKADKAHQLLLEGRVTLLQVEDNRGVVVASCRGMSGTTYHLGWDPRARNGKGEYRCTCEANRDFHRECSHLLALKLVVDR